MIISGQEEGRVAVTVQLPAEIDLANQDRAYDRLYAAIVSGAGVVIADFTSTTFCDCSSLRRLLAIQRRAAAQGAELRLVIPPNGQVYRLAQFLDVHQLLRVYPATRDAASGTTPRPSMPRPRPVAPAARVSS